MGLGECAGMVAPFYNLVLVTIVVILFIVLLRTKTKVDNKPWKLLFVAIIIFIIETFATIMGSAGIVVIPRAYFGLLEMGIISIFIYTLLLQKEAIKKTTKKKK